MQASFLNNVIRSYELEVITTSKNITKKFVVDKDDDALVISVDI